MTQLADALKAWTASAIDESKEPPVLMLSGAQGIGKTTALTVLSDWPSKRVATLSLDDFYLTRAERQILSQQIHPLCETRGPPGTHDVDRLVQTLSALRAGKSVVSWPMFDKARDDRVGNTAWEGKADAILIEGWLLGALPKNTASTSAPVNALEESKDPNGTWRAWQEDALSGPYAALWDQADRFFHIDAPDFSAVLNWRIEQEETTLGLTKGSLPEPRKRWVKSFIQHYERITRRMLDGHRWDGAAFKVGFDREPL